MSEQSFSVPSDPFIWRFFGWASLFVLAVFLINNVITLGFDLPGPKSALSSLELTGLLQVGLYVVAIIAAFAQAKSRSAQSILADSEAISNFNAYIIRGCFFAVLFVGIVDASIAFLRVERLLDVFVPEDMVGSFSRSNFVGAYFHVPLVALGFLVALFSRSLGFVWLALMIVGAELAIVISRFVFSYEQALMGDLVRYWYAALFLFASAYTLLEEGHVRVDILYAGFGKSKRGFVNAFGSVFFGMTTCWVIIVIGFAGKRSMINSPVMNFEVSQTGSAGMFIKYQMAVFLGVFAITMLIQLVSYFFAAIADVRGERPDVSDVLPQG